MNERWIEIFRAGTHTDMSGKTVTWTVADIDAIVEKYDPQLHEAPIVIGHPKTNAPAYGWVKALRRNGEILEGLMEAVDPAFGDAVEAGYWKKRSISLYPDRSLRHVGFLGATPPAIKGLKDVSFAAEPEAITIDFATTNKEKEHMDPELEEELRRQITERDEKLTQFGEQMTLLQGQLNTVSATLEGERASRREGTLENFCDTLVAGGHVLPAEKPAVMELMRVLDSVGEYSFADGTKSPVDALVKLLNQMPDRIEFGEHATHAAAGNRGKANSADYGESVDADRMAIHEQAVTLAKEKNISYAEAVIEVMEGDK